MTGGWSLTQTESPFRYPPQETAAEYGVVESRPVPEGSNILRDEVILLHQSRRRSGPEAFLRRIEVWVEEKRETIVFLTNNLKLAASTIAAIYKERWQIELFFKALKQSLKIRTFVGTTENAVQTQIWTALIAMLVVKYLQLRSTFNWSLSNLVALLRQQLFVYRDLFSGSIIRSTTAAAGFTWWSIAFGRTNWTAHSRRVLGTLFRNKSKV